MLIYGSGRFANLNDFSPLKALKVTFCCVSAFVDKKKFYKKAGRSRSPEERTTIGEIESEMAFYVLFACFENTLLVLVGN